MTPAHGLEILYGGRTLGMKDNRRRRGSMPSTVMKLSDSEKENLRSVFGPAYMSSMCVAMAAAAHRRTGWPIVVLRSQFGEMMHAGINVPGKGFLDVRGVLPEGAFRGNRQGALSWAEEKALMEEAGITEVDVDKAMRLLCLLFEDLPGENALAARFGGFAEALEALCREHEVWLRGDGPCGIIAYEVYGEEVGFEVSFGPTGEARFERLLGQPVEPLRRFA